MGSLGDGIASPYNDSDWSSRFGTFAEPCCKRCVPEKEAMYWWVVGTRSERDGAQHRFPMKVRLTDSCPDEKGSHNTE